MVPTQQGQPFIQVASQQFRPVGQGMPSSHVGMPAAQSQHLQFSQPIQQLPPWPNQPGAPSAQALSMPYGQLNRPLTSSQPQQNAPPLSNHMHVVGTSGVPNSSPYAVRTHKQISSLCLLAYFMGCLLDLLLKFCIVSVCTIFFWPDTKQCQCIAPVPTNVSNACTCCTYGGTALVVLWKSWCFTCSPSPAYCCPAFYIFFLRFSKLPLPHPLSLSYLFHYSCFIF